MDQPLEEDDDNKTEDKAEIIDEVDTIKFHIARADPAVSTNISDTSGTAGMTLKVQSKAPWGLARISARDNPFLSNDSEPTVDYSYNVKTPQIDTWAYVVDGGLNARHPDFGNRAILGANVLCGPVQDCHKNREGYDASHSHGTMVAGIIGSNTFGVAKKTNIVSVKVLVRRYVKGGESDLIQGFNWIQRDIEEKSRARKTVINISLSGQSIALARAIKSLTTMGVFVGKSAGKQSELQSSRLAAAGLGTYHSLGCLRSSPTLPGRLGGTLWQTYFNHRSMLE